MDNEELVKNWHEALIVECTKRLGRNLTEDEGTFITSRGGFIALEIIEDSVKTLDAIALKKYLNSGEPNNKN